MPLLQNEKVETVVILILDAKHCFNLPLLLVISDSTMNCCLTNIFVSFFFFEAINNALPQ